MDAKEKAPRGGSAGEISLSMKKSEAGGDVVVQISNEGALKGTNASSFKDNGTESSCANVRSVPVNCPSPEASGFSPGKPPKYPTGSNGTSGTVTRRKSLQRSVYSRSKSRFVEPSQTVGDILIEEDHNAEGIVKSPHRSSGSRASPHNKSVPVTPRTPLMASPGAPGIDDFEEIYNRVEKSKEKNKRFGIKVLIQWVVFLCLIGVLITSLVVNRLENFVVWGLELWKWCVLVIVIFCGLYITSWFMLVLVFLIEKNFMLQKKVLYFVHGLKKSVQFFLWLSVILNTWVLLFNRKDKRSETAAKVLDYVTWTLVTVVIGSFLWVLKNLFMKILASNFHVRTFFDRIQESVFHQYVLQTLSGPPLVEEARRLGNCTPNTGKLSFNSTRKGKGTKEKKVIDMGKVHGLKREKVSAWNMKILVDAVTNSGLCTISNTLEECYNDGTEQTDKEITNEMEAKAAAHRIFKYIDEEDLLRFMIKEEVDLVFPLFEGAETGRIDKKALADWVVKVYNERKALAHALTDTKTAVKQLNKIVTAILIVVTIIIWLLLMEIATTKVILLLSSQLVAAAFLFGNTCKTIFEAIIFVFVMHPFDVGDRCVIDGVPLLVEEMNILNTVFLKLDNEKVYYPNSVLSTKPISNYYRSPDMGDTVEFSIDFRTPIAKIGLLRERIEKYFAENPQHWQAIYTLVVKEIENVNKIKMALYCNHTITFQQWAEKNRRRTELMYELKRIFEDLGINYNLLPQEVLLRDARPESSLAERQ